MIAAAVAVSPPISDNPDPVRLELARQLQDKMGAGPFSAAANLQNMRAFDELPAPGLDGETHAAMRAALAQGLEVSATVWAEGRARQIASLFSEAELKGLLTWESGADGKAWRDQEPRLRMLDLKQRELFASEMTRAAGRILCENRPCAAFLENPPPAAPGSR